MTEQKSLYLTTPIYYVNDIPHVGHAYTTIAADVVTRARGLRGRDAFLLTGTDEHGQNIERIARERGIPEQQHCDEIAARFKDLWKRLDIAYDGFIRTTDAIHKRGVLALWERLRTARCPDGREAVYKGTYAGWYCPRCEAFKTQDELRQPGNLCPDHERPCEWTEEENLFFRLSAYSDWLADEIGAGRIRIDPAGRRNEVLAVIRQGLQDFSISRARVKWGIAVPDDPGHVFYVWMDALANYITALGFGEADTRSREPYHRYWEEAGERFHLVGKEIIRFHCLYWPAMLKAAGVPVPTRLFAHGHLTKNGKKLSKTTGNVIDPEALLAQWGPDAVRYFLLREGSFGQDWDFTDSAFVVRYNADLANDLGNLVSRALTMVERYCGGRVPPKPASRPSTNPSPMNPPVVEEDLESDVLRSLLVAGVLDRYESLEFATALGLIWEIVRWLNQRIAVVAPWEVAKHPERKEELEAFLYRWLEAIRLLTILASPVMPRAASRIFRMLGIGDHEPRPDDLKWGLLEPGTPIGAIESIFPRVETARAAEKRENETRQGGKGSQADQSKEKTVNETKPPAAKATDAATEQRTASGAEFTSAERAGVPGGATEHPLAQPRLGAEFTSAERAGVQGGAAQPPLAQIDIADFAKVELRAAVIKEAEKIAGSKRLIKLLVDLGGETRQVVAGIAESYAPEALVGKRIVLVANLKPAKLMGVESNGMVLAGSVDGKAVLCTFDGDVAPGTKVK